MAVEKKIYERKGKNVTVNGHLFEVINYSGILENKEPEKHLHQLFMPVDKIRSLSYLSDMTLLFLKINGFERKDRI